MMKPKWDLWWVLTFLMVLAAFGCESGIPNGILEVESMIPIVKDLQIAYAGVDAMMPNPELRSEKYKEVNTLVLAKHQIDSNAFFNSFQYYQNNPVLMDSIFKNVVDQINQDILDLDRRQGRRPNLPDPEMEK